MQDVIFNGSGNRKPLARASVELIFDNAQGRAAGQWSQYAEISVKRTLQRDGESNYFINGTHVRRRDITDMFLGTGLGPRAYAIIEQGMISRVIEAKPEELRVFLEEAAGISRYKERRRETENRLADTRENLARVTDIRLELGSAAREARGAGQGRHALQGIPRRPAAQAAPALVPAARATPPPSASVTLKSFPGLRMNWKRTTRSCAASSRASRPRAPRTTRPATR